MDDFLNELRTLQYTLLHKNLFWKSMDASRYFVMGKLSWFGYRCLLRAILEENGGIVNLFYLFPDSIKVCVAPTHTNVTILSACFSFTNNERYLKALAKMGICETIFQ